MTTPEQRAELEGRLAILKWAYRELTGHDLITDWSTVNGEGVYAFCNGAQEPTLKAAVDYAGLLVHRAMENARKTAAQR